MNINKIAFNVSATGVMVAMGCLCLPLRNATSAPAVADFRWQGTATLNGAQVSGNFQYSQIYDTSESEVVLSNPGGELWVWSPSENSPLPTLSGSSIGTLTVADRITIAVYTKPFRQILWMRPSGQPIVEYFGFGPLSPSDYNLTTTVGPLNLGVEFISNPTLSTNMGPFYSVYGAGSFQVTVSALGGDFNSNGVVDAADYVVWRKSNGPSTDYDLWRTHYGQPFSGSGSSIESTSVPEPSTLLLLGIGAITLIGRRKSKSHG